MINAWRQEFDNQERNLMMISRISQQSENERSLRKKLREVGTEIQL